VIAAFNGLRKNKQRDANYIIVKCVPPNSSLGLTEYDNKMISPWNFGITQFYALYGIILFFEAWNWEKALPLIK
jgi:hypothetical protein